MANRSFILLALFLLCIGGVLAAGLSRGWFEDSGPLVEGKQAQSQDGVNLKSDNDSTRRTARTLNKVLGIDEASLTTIGGVRRPKTDIDRTQKLTREFGEKNPLPNTGLPDPISPDTGEQVRFLADELKKSPVLNRTATSIYTKAEPFDLKNYNQNPEEYLSKIRPSRVYQTAAQLALEPTKTGKSKTEAFPALNANSNLFQTILFGETVNLSAKGTPGMPVTFHTNQYGTFENSLKTMSVKFGEDGFAKVSYTAGPGALGLIKILAASPVHTGQLKFVVRVLSPNN